MAHAHKAQVHNAQVTGWVGWIMTASLLMGIAGALHIILGFAAIMSQGWYIAAGSGSVYLLETAQWGWALLIGGLLMLLSSALLYRGNMVGRVLGAILVIGSLAANFSLFMATPIWSTIAIVLGFVILYAIVAHGSEMQQLEGEEL